MNYKASKIHKDNLNVYCLVKENYMISLYTLWPQNYDNLEKVNFTDTKKISGCQWLGTEGEDKRGGAQQVFRGWNNNCVQVQHSHYCVMQRANLDVNIDSVNSNVSVLVHQSKQIYHTSAWL